MKTKYLGLLLFFVQITGWAQYGCTEPVDIQYSGKWTSYYYDNKEKAFEGDIIKLNYNPATCPVGELRWKYTFDGIYQSWYKNGIVSQRLYYKNGKMQGCQQYWNKTGKPILIRYYHKGKLLEEKTINYNNTTLYRIIKKTRKWQIIQDYNQQGRLVQEVHYKGNRHLYSVKYDEKGNITQETGSKKAPDNTFICDIK